MRSWIFISLLSCIGAVLQCDLTDKQQDLPFPDIESEGIESYQMSVEYTAYGATQTDFYTEFYDILSRRGRVDSHQAGKSFSYVYKTASWEAWEISKDKCDLQNITDTPKLYRDDQTEWTYMPADKPDKRTIGPSAMFKVALDAWNNAGKDRPNIMAYMGNSSVIRGLKAHRWRRCDGDGSYVDYYFTADNDVNPFGLPKLMRLPLRVLFGGVRKEKDAEMSEQQYEILSFQPYISLDKRPFQLPVGQGCARGYVPDAPEIPSFKDKNVQFHAEVIYRTLTMNGDGAQYWSYYSTLFLALDRSSDHIAYYYAPWSKTKPTEDPEVDASVHTIFDSKYGYKYSTPLDTGKCEITRVPQFVPEYRFPNDAGSISLLDASILMPQKELTFITEGTHRGLRVNVFEEVITNYTLLRQPFKPIPKAVITHSYLQDDEIERDTVSVRNSLVQVQMRFTGRNNTVEILTFNFFGLTTDLKHRRSIFNIKRCFKNDTDYAWATIGFKSDTDKLQKAIIDVPSIRSSIINDISLKCELDTVRIPIAEVDVVKDEIFVSLMILGKPPLELDYQHAKEGWSVMGNPEKEGVGNFQVCGMKCLEEKTNCWGFAVCGAECHYGTSKVEATGSFDGCQLYMRYDKTQYIPSKESIVKSLRSLVGRNDEGLQLELNGKDDNMIKIDASSIEVTYPGADDKRFGRIGNTLSPRMRIVKVGYRLTPSAGTPITNMGVLRYDECQRLCLDFKDCETASYCLRDSQCMFTSKYGDDLDAKTDMREDNMCNLITRKYGDRFDRTPGLVMVTTAQEILQLDSVEKCARACLTSTKFKCLSFDHCPVDSTCSLHTVHYPNANTREKESNKSSNCGHYFRKFSTEFKKFPKKRMVGSKLPPLNSLTLEECSKYCMEYGKGTCFGFDFCQGDTILATTCNLIDSDPSQMKSTFNPLCTNYLRSEAQLSSRPFSNGYAGGIGFLCFLIGGLVGVAIVIGINHVKKNNRR